MDNTCLPNRATYFALFIIFNLANGCNSRSENPAGHVEHDRELYSVEHEKATHSELSERRSFLGFSLYSSHSEAALHLNALANEGKLDCKGITRYLDEKGNVHVMGKVNVNDENLFEEVSYEFNVPDKNGIYTPLKFEWDEDRLKSLSGQIRANSNDWINSQILGVFETRLGHAKSFYYTDATRCYYWIKGGQEVLLIFPLNDNPKFSYTALVPTKEFVNKQNMSARNKVIHDSLGALKTANDL